MLNAEHTENAGHMKKATLFDQTIEMIDTITDGTETLSENIWATIFMQESEIFRQQLIIRLRSKARKLKVPMKSFDSVLTSFKSEQKKSDKSKALKAKKGFSEDVIVPVWYADYKLDEIEFCDEMLQEHPMKCINGTLFDVNGVIPDKQVAHKIQDMISPYITSGVSKKVNDLMGALKTECYSDPPPLDTKHIHVANGTLSIDGTFSARKLFCLNRLNVNYDSKANEPVQWLKFLNDLLVPEDIITLQQYLGYCLIPTTQSQVAMFIIGNGGEGKSIISTIAKNIFGNAAVSGKLEKIESDPFAVANMENKLLFIEDDMQTGALKETQNLKQIITARIPMLINKKNVQPYEAMIFSRILALGNAQMRSLFDHSDGFLRRQIIIRPKPKPKGRVDDLTLDEKLLDEKPQIFNWCFQGLQCLIKDGFHFLISDRTKANLEAAREDNCNVADFLENSGYIKFNPDSTITSTRLVCLYQDWCADNAIDPLANRTMLNYVESNAEKYKIKRNYNIINDKGKRCRGFSGIQQVGILR